MDNNTLDSILRNASNPTGGVSQQKQTAVAETAAAKKAAMAPSFSADQLYPMVVGNQNGAGVASATQAELDARTMPPMAMWEKFGYTPETNTLLGNRAEATNQIVNDQTVSRDWNQTAADAVSAIGLGAANGIGGIGALGAGVVSTDAGNAIAQSLDTLNKDVMDNQSPALQARRRLNQAANLNDQRDSAQQLQEDIAAGGSESWSGIKRIGRDAISSIGNASADPITLLDGTAQGAGSLVLTGPVGRASGAVNTSAILAARNAGVLSKDTARMLATAADKGGIAALIGGMEAGGSFQQTANQVLGMDFAQLEQNSPDFRKLIAAGTTPEDARAVLANKAGLEAAAITAPAAVALGKFVAKFEAAPMSTAGLKSSLATIGTQVMEEGAQGGVSQGAGNLAVARNADDTQELTAGVGEQIGTGALYGGLMAGGVQAPALAARGAGAAVGATLNAVGNIGAAEPAPASAPTTIGVVTDSAKNAEQAASLVPAGEAVMASVMGNDTLDEPTKQAQVTGLQTLQSNFVYSPEDYAAARSVDAALPEALGERLSQVNNLPQAIHEVGTHVMGIANNPTPESIGEFVASVGYLDALLERVDSLAGLPEVNAVLAGITPGSAEEGYIQSIIQAQDNAANSQMVSKARTVIAAKLAKAAPMAQVTLETAGEALVRAKYAPQTMSQQVIDATLAMAEAGQIEITPMQRIRLQAADALVRAMAAGETTDAADTVTRQIAFNDTKEGGQSYPSLVEHTNSITNAVVKGNTKLGKDQMVQLRNFAVTMANKMTAINNYIADNSIGRQKYQNWIPTENKWRESAMGLDVNMSSKKSQNFGKRIHTEAMLAAATYNNLLELFPDLAATTSVPLPMPTMNKSLASALTRNSTPKTAAAPAPAVPAAVTEPTKVNTPAAPVEESTIAPANQAPALTEQAPAAIKKVAGNTITDASLQKKGLVSTPEVAATPSTTFTQILNEDYVGLDKPADVLEFAKEAKAELAALKKVDEPTADQQKVADRLDNMFKEDTSFDWDTFMSEADGATPADFNALSEITSKEPLPTLEAFPELESNPAPALNQPEVVATNTVAVATPQQAAHMGLLPGLNGAPNEFTSMFKVKDRNRTQKMEQPYFDTLDALESAKAYSTLAGDGVTVPIRKQLEGAKLFVEGVVGPLYAGVRQQMHEMLNTVKGKYTSSIGDAIRQASVDASGIANPTALAKENRGSYTALLDESSGQLGYNEHMLQSATLAAGQWFLSAGGSGGAKMSEAQVASYVGIPADKVTAGLVSLVSSGISDLDAIRGISDKIQSYWGASIKDAAPGARAESIPQGLAATLFHTLVHGGPDSSRFADDYMTVKEIIVDTTTGNVLSVHDLNGQNKPATIPKFDPKTTKNIRRYIPNSLPEELRGISPVVGRLLEIEPEDVTYFSPEDLKVSRTQLRSDVPLTKEERTAQDAQQQVAHKLNTTFAGLIRQLSADDMVALLGEPITDVMNVRARVAAEGKNASVLGGYNQAVEMLAQIEGEAAARKVDPETVGVHFKYETTSTNRSMMQGKYNPQSNKTMRNMLMPMEATVDLTNADDRLLWDTASLQMMGERTYAMSESKISELAARVFNQPEMLTLIDVLKPLVQGKPTTGLVQAFQAAAVHAKDGMTNEFMHVMLDRARFALAEDGGASFTSQLYLEADGVANGPAGAMAMLAVGAQDGLPEYVAKMRKAGLFIGLRGQYMALHREVDDIDLYALSGANAVNATVTNWAERSGGSPEAEAQHASMLEFISKMMPAGSVELEPASNGEYTLKINRGAAKNPMTVTVYGSGERGIASKLTTIIVDELADRINTALRTGDYTAIAAARNSLAQMTHTKPVWVTDSAGGKRLKLNSKPVPAGFMRKEKLDEFQLTGEQYETLQTNIHEFFVKDLSAGITETVGASTMAASRAMVAATNVQALVLQVAYRKAIAALKERKIAADPNWSESMGLSRKDQKALQEELKFLSPIIRSTSQIWDIVGTQRARGEAPTATDIHGRYSVPSNSMVPGEASVKAAPYLVIGNGDASMVQKLFNMVADGTAPKSILQVFDGINLGLNDIKTGGLAANQAMAEAWLDNNPLKDVAASFKVVAELGDIAGAIETLGAKDQERLLSSLDEFGGISGLQKWLDNQAAEVEMQHEAIKEVGYSADQMAATGMAHTVNGTLDQSSYIAETAEASAIEAAAALTAAIDRRRPVKQTSEAFNALLAGAPKDQYGNTVLDLNMAKALVASAEMTPEQRSLATEALATNSEALKDLRVVLGTGETLVAGGYDFNSSQVNESLLAQRTRGLWDEGTKTLVLAPGFDGDTIAHELVHASTLSALTAAMDGTLPDTKWGNAIKGSAAEVQAIFLQAMGEHSTTLPHISDAARSQYMGMVGVVRNMLGIGVDASITDAYTTAPLANKVQALNEFMAYSLANSKIRAVTKMQWFNSALKAVYGLIRNVVFGARANAVPKAQDDMLSQLEFHTRVLMTAREGMAQRGIQEMLTNPMVMEARILGDDHAQMVAKAFNDTVGSYITARSDKLTQVLRKAEYQQGVLMAADMVNTASAVGFLGSPVQRTAFLQMAAAMATQADLSPAVMQEAQALYRETAKNINTGLGLSQDQVDLVLGRAGIEEDAQGRSSLVPMFFALGTVDPTFREALTKISAPNVKQEGGDTLDTKLQALGNNVLAKIQQSMVGTAGAPNVTAALNALAETVIDHARKEENLLQQMDTRAMGMVNKGNEWVVARMESASKSIAAKAQRVSAGTKSKTVKTTAQIVGLTANIFNEDGAKANAEAMLAMANRGMSGVVRSVVKDLTGRVDSNAQVYDLIKSASQQVSKIRQFFKEDLPSVLSAGFKSAPTPEQWSHLFKSMAKVDIASLVQGNDLNAALNLAVDKSARTAEIARLEAALKLADPKTFGRVMKKSHQLAAYLTTGVAGSALLRNADAVANLLNDKVSGMTAPGVAPKPASYVAMVDQLITLYALEVQPKDVMSTFEDMRKSEPEGMQQLLGVMLAQRTKDAQRHTGNARFNAIKGYIPSDGTAGASMIVADTRDDDNLRQKGYTKVADYKGTPLFKTSTLAYYFTPVGKAPFNQGIIQNARMTAGGVDQSTGFAVGIPTAGRIVQKTTVDRLARNMHLDTGREALMPLFNEAGQIYAFERSIDPTQLDRLQPSTHAAAMLGQWMGRQAEEEMAQAVNFDAVAKVHDMWQNAGGRQREFVNVLDPNAFKNDPVTADALRLIPNDVRAQAEKLFGTGKFMVRKDMIDDVFGYRDASFGDAWTGNSRWSPKTQDQVRKLAEKFLGADAFRIVSQREQQWKNLVKDAKTLIVVKSMVVPAANFVANIFQLMARGVPLSTIAKGLRNKTLEIDQYVKSHVEKMELQVKLMAAGGNTTARQKYEAQIQAIDDSWKRLSIWPLIEAGEFGSISDAGISRDEILLSEGKLQAYLEAKTDKLPPGIRSMGKNMLITKDTALFQGLQKSMEYGDFLAKAILFDQKTGQGMSKVDALGEITDEFVNYDRLPGRFRGSLENLGLLWFYNYKLRIAKVAFSMLRRDPLRVLLLSGSAIPGMELPLSENIFTKGIEGTLGYSIGPGMLFSAPGLNPWAAALQ